MNNRFLLPICALLAVSTSLTVRGQWNNPLVYYQFDESSGALVVDSSGNHFDGMANCDNCWEAEGRFNGAFHFQGVQKIQLPAQETGLTNEKGTVAFWMLLPPSSVNSINCIWWAGEYGGDMFGPQNEMHINSEFVEENIWAGGEIAFVIRDSVADDSYFIFSDPEKGPDPATPPSENAITLADGKWHHIACTWESGGTVGMYIDGQAIWDTTLYHPNLWECNLMTIGAANERSNRRLSGYLDEFRIYDEALGIAEIEEIYQYIPEDLVNSGGRISQGVLKRLNCFPNPADRQISFIHSRGIELIEIYSLTGKKVRSQQISDAEGYISMNIDPLSPGCYLIEAYGNQKLIAVSKFFKK
jgi:hypothetical protein